MAEVTNPYAAHSIPRRGTRKKGYALMELLLLLVIGLLVLAGFAVSSNQDRELSGGGCVTVAGMLFMFGVAFITVIGWAGMYR